MPHDTAPTPKPRHLDYWRRRGERRTDAWTRRTGSRVGPPIPNTLAAGDDRGLTPQGLALDPASGNLVQSYYGYNARRQSVAALSLIDEESGEQITEVRLGRYTPPDDAPPSREDAKAYRRTPRHAGGVVVDGDEVLVTDRGRVFTYSLATIRAAAAGDTVGQSRPSRPCQGGSYAALDRDTLYLGDFTESLLYVYHRTKDSWQRAEDEPLPAPKNAQGLVVREEEFVFTTSFGRHNRGRLVVVRRADRKKLLVYRLPNMAEGVVALGDELITTYESGAQHYATRQWRLRRSLWAGATMTRTPLSELGLGPEPGPTRWQRVKRWIRRKA
ncbi:MAG: hypothetical protein QM621_08815 [Aeromicrobium sp.]|uniref:hypothetical protein n=1 Tax=Aeromicrobium sp. TaxID=1871063 RepID=UPI0039E45DF7